jgi:putative endonuclease
MLLWNSWAAHKQYYRYPEGRKRSERSHQLASSPEGHCVLAMDKFSYVYMMGSSSRRALYTGVGADLYKRVWEHKNNLGEYFTSKYKCHRLVYFEKFTNIETAIAREKEIKGWRREKKNALVESLNPQWKDLAEDWYPDGLMRDGKLVK